MTLLRGSSSPVVNLLATLKRLLRLSRRKRLGTQDVIQEPQEATVQETNSKQYEYSDLESLDTIRLMRLLPSSTDASPIRIEMEPFTLKHARRCYDALSYTWGDPNLVEDAIIPTAKATISIRKGLAEVLRALRLDTKERVLWVDAVCINQVDGEEKAAQLQLMAEIYSQASEVIAWVGEETQNTILALESFKAISTNVTADWQRLELISLGPTDSAWADREKPVPLDDAHLCAVVDFFKRQYFSRLWIWQELHFGRQHAKIMCGRNTIPWQTLSDAVFVLFHKQLPAVSAHEITSFIASPQMEYICGLCDGQGYSLPEALERSRLAQCTDERDRVFALLSLVGDNGYGIHPQYQSVSIENVYLDTALKVMGYERSLNLLLYVRSSDNRLQNLPSWVPDWTAPGPHRILSHTDAGPFVGDPVFKVSNGLQVRGCLVAQVKRVRPFRVTDDFLYERTDIENALRDMIFPDVISRVLQKEDLLLAMLCRTLCCSVLADTWLDTEERPSLQWPTLDECAAVLVDIFGSQYRTSEPIEDDIKQRTLSTLMHYCIGQALIETESGHLGLAPASTKDGDAVAVLAGCSAATILRPYDEGRFTLVGAAYLDGVMDGEAIRGPLPEGYRTVMVFEKGSWHRKYSYVGRKLSSHDPRLDRLSQSQDKNSAYSASDVGTVWHGTRLQVLVLV